VQKARQVFESFPPGLRRALESGSLDEVNKVLGQMSVEEAEEIVGQLGEVRFPSRLITCSPD
jgi:cell division cycle protein 37